MDYDFDCQTCDDILQKERGCTEKGIIPFYIAGERIFKCPYTLVDSGSWQYIKAYNLFEKGFLPNGTSWINESHKYLQAINVLQNHIAKKEEKCQNKH